MKILRAILTVTVVIFLAIIAGTFSASFLKNKTAVIRNNSLTTTGSSTTPTTTSCIITIDGEKYDVGSLRSTHPGGDIFVCGTDMTQVYYSFHNQAFKSHLLRYKVN